MWGRLYSRPGSSAATATEVRLQVREREYFGSASCSETEAAYSRLIPAQMVGQLVAHRALDLRPEELWIVAEVALQRVLVDDDAVRVGVAGDGAADVVAVGVLLMTATGDDHRRALDQLAKPLRQVVQRLHHQLVELARRPLGGR